MAANEMSFCFCKGELVDCIPGRVQDCNVKNLSVCPLKEEKEKKKEKKKEQRAFCFCKGELVDCIPGRVQDCNVKNLSVCPMEEEAGEQEHKPKKANESNKATEEKTNGFCFFKGELVSCSPGRIQDCNIKRTQSCPNDL